MKVNIMLVLDSDTIITSMSDVSFNPFNVNDVISLSVDNISPKRLEGFKKEFQIQLIEGNDILKEMYHLKDIRIVKENKYMDLEREVVEIEYFCKIINK